MSDSSTRTKPSIELPSNMMSPSSAFSNCDCGTSTFLMMPDMSENCSRRNLTSLARSSSSTACLSAPRVRRAAPAGDGRTLCSVIRPAPRSESARLFFDDIVPFPGADEFVQRPKVVRTVGQRLQPEIPKDDVVPAVEFEAGRRIAAELLEPER